jgi:ribosomal protein L37AE/L43A
LVLFCVILSEFRAFGKEMATAKSGIGNGSEAQDDTNALDRVKEDEAPCGACGKMVTNRDKGVWCEVCDKWYHNNCENVTLEVYKLLKKEAPGVH